MADHFYSIAAKGQAFQRLPTNITVATSAQSSNPIEVRITDGALSRQQAYAFLEWLSHELETGSGNTQVIVAGTLNSEQS